jgi:hypothetical protein
MHRRFRPIHLASLAIALALGATLSVPATAAGTHSTAKTTSARGPVLNSNALKKVLRSEGLPTTKIIPTTSTSHPWNGAAWQNKPINLAKYGYVEKEYDLSGDANVYNWVPGSNYSTQVIANGPYTTRMDVRRPKNMRHWSGKVVVEIINMSAGYDWTAIWSALWQRVLKDHDIYVGITSKPNVLPGLQQFDATRYANLSWANPVPADQQACGLLPGDAGYTPNLSKLYENGLVWDILTQTGRLLKSHSAANPLGKPARQVILSGESQSSNFLTTYYRYFTPGATLPTGKPVFDAYFVETQVGITGTPINQCATTTTPLPADDPQATTFPQRSVPWIGINSDWDYPGVRGWTAPADSNTHADKVRFWQIAGSNHGWEWQYLYGDADKTDLLKAGFDDPATYDWSCGPNNPEVPFYMAEKAAYEELKGWAAGGAPPPRAPRILTHDTGTIDTTLYDGLGNAQGGIRFPMIQAPVADLGPGQYALTGDCTDQIKPFDATTLSSLYPTRAAYLKQYRQATQQLLQGGFILKEDVAPLLATAAKVTSIPAQGS